jgi:hypothetical protein
VKFFHKFIVAVLSHPVANYFVFVASWFFVAYFSWPIENQSMLAYALAILRFPMAIAGALFILMLPFLPAFFYKRSSNDSGDVDSIDTKNSP